MFKEISELIKGGMNEQQALEAAGYSKSYARSGNLKRTKGWAEFMEEQIPDDYLMKHHLELMTSRRIEHMIFPLSVKDEEIKELLASVNCVARKIKHGDTANHVWFWANDNRAKKDALDMAYKLKNRYDNTITIKGKLAGLSDEEIEGRIAGILSGVIGAFTRKGEKKE